MCGINLIVSPAPEAPLTALERMQQVSASRGPDAAGTLPGRLNGLQLVLGATRLRITDDHPRADQPLVSPCGRYALAFNGEVYNHADLKNQLLGRGYRFRTASDTETVCCWLQEHGPAGLADLKGMFALVFIDFQEKKILLARDRQGIKPLFWTIQENRLLVSSRLPALLRTGLPERTLNPRAVRQYLAYRYVPGTHTFVKGVQAVAPGTALQFDHRLQPTNHRLPGPPRPAGNLKEALTEILAQVYPAAQPAALLLSGGVDSTLLLALLRHELGLRGVPALTLATGDDAAWAARAARQYGARHHPVPATAASLERLDAFVATLDQPVGDPGALATWLVAAEAARHGRVLLSGAGADELFGGYNRHRALAFALRHPQLMKLAARSGAARRLLPATWRGVLRAWHPHPGVMHNRLLQHYAVKPYRPAVPLWPAANSDPLAAALDYDRQHYLVNDVLSITDNTTMAYSLETRVPYLHDDLVALAAAHPAAEKLYPTPKAPLKTLLAHYGGRPYCRRKKTGFGPPLGEWLRQPGTGWLWAFLQQDDPLFTFVPRSDIDRLLRLHRQGKRDYSLPLWTILVLQRWLTGFYQ